MSKLFNSEPESVSHNNLEDDIETDADSRMIKMYFSHLEDKADSSSSSSASGNSNSEDNFDENSNDGDGTSSYSQSTSSRNAESIISSTGSNGGLSFSTGSGPHPNLAGQQQRPLGQQMKSSGKRKRNQRQFHDYFNANKHEALMYNLIRHTFTGPNDLEYLRQPKTQQTLKSLFETSRNCIKKITPEKEQVETAKVLLISQHTIKQVKKMNLRPSNMRMQNIPFYK